MCTTLIELCTHDCYVTLGHEMLCSEVRFCSVLIVLCAFTNNIATIIKYETL